MSRLARWAESATGTPRRLTTSLGGMKLLRAVLSMTVVVLSARLFGASVERDAWVLASSWIAILAQFLFGPLNEIFRARFVHIKEGESEEKAIHASAGLIGAITAVSLVAMAGPLVAPGPLGQVFAPGVAPADRPTLEALLRWVAPSLLLTELAVVWTGLLNAYRSYFLPEVFGLLTSVLHIVALTLLAPHMGIYALVVSTHAAALLLIWALARRLKQSFKGPLVSRPSLDAVRGFVIMAAPFWIPYTLGQAVLGVERVLCTELGTGSVSMLDYARRFSDFPLGIIYAVLGAALTPVLAAHHARGENTEFRHATLGLLRWLLLGISPLVAVLCANGNAVISVFLVAGKFSAENAAQTGLLLSWLGMGLLGVVAYSVCGQALVASKRSGIYSLASVVIQGLTLGTNLVLYRRLGVQVFAASWASYHLVVGLWLASRLFSFRELLDGHYLRALLACALTIALAFVTRGPVQGFALGAFGAGRTSSVVLLGIQGIIAGFGLLAWIWILGLKEELEIFKRRLSRFA